MMTLTGVLGSLLGAFLLVFGIVTTDLTGFLMGLGFLLLSFPLAVWLIKTKRYW